MIICIKWIWHLIIHKGWYAIKPKQTNQSVFFLIKELHSLEFYIYEIIPKPLGLK